MGMTRLLLFGRCLLTLLTVRIRECRSLGMLQKRLVIIKQIIIVAMTMRKLSSLFGERSRRIMLMINMTNDGTPTSPEGEFNKTTR